MLIFIMLLQYNKYIIVLRLAREFFYIMTTDGFKFNLDKNAKKVSIEVIGSFVPEKEKDFFENYTRISSQINPSEYTLFLDCTHMNIVAQNYVDKLGATFGLYKQTGFGNVLMKLSASAVVKMQLKRLARNADLPFEFIE